MSKFINNALVNNTTRLLFIIDLDSGQIALPDTEAASNIKDALPIYEDTALSAKDIRKIKYFEEESALISNLNKNNIPEEDLKIFMINSLKNIVLESITLNFSEAPSRKILTKFILLSIELEIEFCHEPLKEKLFGYPIKTEELITKILEMPSKQVLFGLKEYLLYTLRFSSAEEREQIINKVLHCQPAVQIAEILFKNQHQEWLQSIKIRVINKILEFEDDTVLDVFNEYIIDMLSVLFHKNDPIFNSNQDAIDAELDIIEKIFDLPGEYASQILEKNCANILYAINDLYNQDIFFEQLLNLPDENISQILEEQLVGILKKANDSSNCYYHELVIDKLLTLPDENISQILKEQLAKIFKETIDTLDFFGQKKVIRKLLTLPDENISQILEKQLVNVLSYFYETKNYHTYKDYVYDYIEKDLIKAISQFNNVGHKINIINNIFKLDQKNLLIFLDNNLKELLNNADEEFKLDIIINIFKLLPKECCEIVEQHLVKNFDQFEDRNKNAIIEKIFKLPQDNIQALLNKNFLYLLHNTEDYTQNNLLENTYQMITDGSVTLDQEVIEQIAKLDKGIKSKRFLKYASSPLSSVDADVKDTIAPLVLQLLKKTYTDLDSNEDKIKLIKELNENISKIINIDDSIKLILERSIEATGEFFIINRIEGNACGQYNSADKNIFIQNSLSSCNTITLIHEAIHKIIDRLYDNTSLPYAKGDQQSTLQISKLIKEALEDNNFLQHKVDFYLSSPKAKGPHKKTQDTWLEVMTDMYDHNKHHAELFTWFIQYFAEMILTDSENSNISNNKMDEIWKSFQELVIKPINNSEIYENYDHLKKYIPNYSCEENTSELALQAKQIIISPPSKEWLDSEAGIIAFNASCRSSKSEIIKDFITTVDTQTIDQKIELFSQTADILLSEMFKLEDNRLKEILECSYSKISSLILNFDSFEFLAFTITMNQKFSKDYIAQLKNNSFSENNGYEDLSQDLAVEDMTQEPDILLGNMTECP